MLTLPVLRNVNYFFYFTWQRGVMTSMRGVLGEMITIKPQIVTPMSTTLLYSPHLLCSPHQLPDQKASQSSLKNDLYTDRTLWKDEPLDCILLSSLMTPYFSRSEVTDRHRLRQQGGDGEMHFCPFVHQGVLFSFFWGSVGRVS